ncbi:MAG: hypothetical protein P8Y97_14080 [Candidatus Lokiarchaeota archaeon]
MLGNSIEIKFEKVKEGQRQLSMAEVIGNSMYQLFGDGSQVPIIEMPSGTIYGEGDIIVFKNSGLNIIHRIEHVFSYNGETYYVTEGINNKFVDDALVTGDQIIGIADLSPLAFEAAMELDRQNKLRRYRAFGMSETEMKISRELSKLFREKVSQGKDIYDLSTCLHVLYEVQGNLDENPSRIFELWREFLLVNKMTYDQDAYNLKVYFEYFKALTNSRGIDYAIEQLNSDEFFFLKEMSLKYGIPIPKETITKMIKIADKFDLENYHKNRDLINKLIFYNKEFYESITRDGYISVYKDPKMQAYYYSELLFTQLGTDLITGKTLSDELSLHHIEQDKSLWSVSALIASLKNHDEYILHALDPDYKEEYVENQIGVIRNIRDLIDEICKGNIKSKEQIIQRLNKIKQILMEFRESFPRNSDGRVINKLRQLYEDIEQFWNDDEIKSFLERWEFMENLKDLFNNREQIKWAYLNKFHPNLVLEHFPDKNLSLF